MLTLMTRVFAFLAVLCAMFLPGLAYGQDPLVCQLAGKQAKCPGNASLPAGTITSGSLPSVGAAGTYAYPQSVTTDAKGRVTSITAGSAFTLPDVGTPGSYQNPGQPVQANPEVAASAGGFADLMVTEARLLQGVTTACGGTYDPRSTGKFVAWVTSDVQKESTMELAASSLTWSQVQRAVETRAREWYLTRARRS